MTAAMWAGASLVFALDGPHPLWLLPEYVWTALKVQIAAILIFAFVRTATLMRTRSDRPLATVWEHVRDRLPLLIIPTLLFPIFLAGFTAAKSGIPHLVGFRHDWLFTRLDAMMFGEDPWRLTHALLGARGTVLLEYLYVWGWIAVVGYSAALIPLCAAKRTVAVFFAASFLTWFFGGFVGAYFMASAGPTFGHLVDPDLAARFAPMKARLATLLPPGSPFLNGPRYLEIGISTRAAFSGGGISAMPSMHIASVFLLVLAARGTRWLIPACVFVAVIFIGSIHSGYHYAVDGIVAVGIAWACWQVAETVFGRSAAVK